MNQIKFTEDINKLIRETQIIAAKGLLGCKGYETILDRNTIYFITSTILSGVIFPTTLSLPLAIPIIVGIGTLGLLTYTVSNVVERYYFHQNSLKLKPFFEDILSGKFQNPLPQYFYEFSPIIAVDTLDHKQRREDLLRYLQFHFILLQSLNIICDQPEKFESLRKVIEDQSPLMRGNVGYRALELIDYMKNNKSSKIQFVSQDTKAITKILWDNFIQYFNDFNSSDRLSINGVSLSNIRTFISYLKQSFPAVEYEKHFQTCKTSEDFYQTAKKIKS